MKISDQRLSVAKQYFEGTCRTRGPADSVSWLKPIAEQIGVTRLASVTGLDIVGIPVWLAIRPNSKGLATAQGKGVSDEAAQASALMEAIENWHAENIDLPVRVADYSTLCESHNVVAPADLPHDTTSPLRNDLPIAWLEGWDLVAQEPCWVPFDSVSTNYVVSHQNRLETPFAQSSNGLAGGNHLLEAINHALAEVIERQAIATHEAKIRGFAEDIRIDPSTVSDPSCRQLLATLDSREIDYALFDLSEGIGIPAFACLIVDGAEASAWRSLPPFNGYGCHVEASIALSRSITEAVQSRLTYISGSRDDILDSEYRRSSNRDDIAAIRALVHGRKAGARFQESSASSELFEDDTNVMLDAVRAAGHDRVIVVNLTRPEFGVPVVRVLVPGMSLPATMVGQQEHRREPSNSLASEQLA